MYFSCHLLIWLAPTHSPLMTKWKFIGFSHSWKVLCCMFSQIESCDLHTTGGDPLAGFDLSSYWLLPKTWGPMACTEPGDSQYHQAPPLLRSHSWVLQIWIVPAKYIEGAHCCWVLNMGWTWPPRPLFAWLMNGWTFWWCPQGLVDSASFEMRSICQLCPSNQLVLNLFPSPPPPSHVTRHGTSLGVSW